jgi:hypothetical protein
MDQRRRSEYLSQIGKYLIIDKYVWTIDQLVYEDNGGFIRKWK